MAQIGTTSTTTTPNRLLNAAIWASQVFIFLVFAWAGWLKVTSPIADLAKMLPWTGQVPTELVRITGVIDLLGGIGMVLPSLTRIKPNLTILAALGCFALQICAMIFHVSRGEIFALPLNILLLFLSAFVFWGRRRLPVAPR